MPFVSLPVAGQTCGNPPGFNKVWTEGKAVLFKSSKLNVDADGAPNSYLVDGKGLSYTCDGVVAVENGSAFKWLLKLICQRMVEVACELRMQVQE